MSGFPLNVLYSNPGAGYCAPEPCVPCGGDPCGVPGNGFGPFAQGANPIYANALETIQPFRAVVVSSGGVRNASNDNPAHRQTYLGITGAGALANSSVAIFWGGPVTNNINGSGGWNWTLGQPVYLGTNGLLTQTPPAFTDGFTKVVGMPLSANTIEVFPPNANYAYNPGTMAVVAGVLNANPDNFTQWLSGSISSNVALTIGGSPVEGQALSIAIAAVGGARTVTLGSQFVIPTSSSTTSPLTINSGTETVIGLRFRAADSKWRVVAVVAGY